jgi:hypothetical protein
MRALIKDSEHLLRMGGLYVLGTIALLVLRFFLVPADFGEFGHFRSGAIADNREREPSYGGQAVCADCHGDVVTARSEGAHARVGCEACHGPLASHAEALTEVLAVPSGTGVLCMVCHSPATAKPTDFPQIDEEQHAAGESCDTCHDPHRPDL